MKSATQAGKRWRESSCDPRRNPLQEVESEQTLSVVAVKPKRSRPDELFIRRLYKLFMLVHQSVNSISSASGHFLLFNGSQILKMATK